MNRPSIDRISSRSSAVTDGERARGAGRSRQELARMQPPAGGAISPTKEAGPSWPVSILFLLVTFLQLTDLLTSSGASTAQWEVNPFLAALGDQLTPALALAIGKLVCGLLLAALFGLWTRLRMDRGFCFALGTVLVVYVPSVLGNVFERW